MIELEENNHKVDVPAFRKALIAWGQANFRPFPWRILGNPYYILMAEIMLHRTQALQVVPVYQRFVQRFPDPLALTRASKDELHDALYSLGLRWRIDLVYDMAAHLLHRFGACVPEAKEDLLSLPGVSDYIASAVRCFSWNLPEAIIDTNTVRVVGRLFGLQIKDSSRRNARFRLLITGLVDPSEPRAYNYALLDLADAICTKTRSPLHLQCPVLGHCLSGQTPPLIY